MCRNGEITMNVQKLFHVLVLGGAAITACSDDGASDTGAGGEGPEENKSGSGAAPTTSTAASGGSETAGSGAAGGASTGEGGTTSAGGGEAPTCSDTASPTDPCGCPCCWAECPNTDEACCAGFCASGNDGAGCCGL